MFYTSSKSVIYIALGVMKARTLSVRLMRLIPKRLLSFWHYSNMVLSECGSAVVDFYHFEDFLTHLHCIVLFLVWPKAAQVAR